MISDVASSREGITSRTAILSILGFWAFHFVIVTLRAAVLGFDDQLEMLVRRAVVTLVSIGITMVVWLLLRRVHGAPLSRRVAAAALLAVPASIVYSAVNYYVFYDFGLPKSVVIANKADEKTLTVQVDMTHADEKSPVMAIADNAANGYFFFAAWAALFLALTYAAETGHAERRVARFRAAAQSAELRALRYQVNPHFLFNTLNSLSSLIMTDRRDAAEAMVMNLSTFFRTSLTGDPTEDMRLSDELRLQRLYLDIETVRFPERMLVDIAVPDALMDACVPGLILQPLIENAIKYGVSPARRVVRISVRARESEGRLVLAVEDDGDDKPTGATIGEPGVTNGIGLRNVRERLAARFGDAADAAWGRRPGGGWAVVLTMPLVRNGC
ncbi:sensor histidine kinase [Sphingomonas jatrophae]|uniref:Histidine kinase n=1 Tax=Sphingomonas jatrophae TaxID=1166337 RepID=A0A1I6LC04_9SPHN|nr:histidine kinase [Sphingomonas jatrophae]SFS01005.1 Histidine kinase [Sphingomonas jatrophae]